MGNQINSASRSPIISISFPENGALRARKVVTRSGTRVTGKLPSWKMNRMIHWESIHERNAIQLLNAEPRVATFNEQPCVIHFVMDGEEHWHFPDLLVCYGSSMDFWEVKTEVEAADAKIQQRTALLKSSLPCFGYGYRLAVSKDLAIQPRLKNINQLLWLGYDPVPLVEEEKIRLLVAQAGGIPWQLAVDGHLGKFGRQHLCRLVLEGHLRFDINQAWTSSTLFTPGVISVLIQEG